MYSWIRQHGWMDYHGYWGHNLCFSVLHFKWLGQKTLAYDFKWCHWVEYRVIFQAGLDLVQILPFPFCWRRRSEGESVVDNLGCWKLGCAARPWEVFTVQLLLCQQQEQLYSTFLWVISLVRFEYFLVFLERLLWHIFTYLLELFQHIFSYRCVNSVDTGQLYLFWEILRKNTKEENPFFTASGYLSNKKTLVAKKLLLFETDISNFSSRSTKACWHWNYPGRK